MGAVVCAIAMLVAGLIAGGRQAAPAQPLTITLTGQSMLRSDLRASARYRSAMAAIITRRAIETAAARARGGWIAVPASSELHGGLG